MKVLYDSEDFQAIVGCGLRRWYVGIAYETDDLTYDAAVFRIGPFYLQLVKRIPA